MRKAKKDNGILEDMVVWTIDEETGELHMSDLAGIEIVLEKYEGKEVKPAYPYAIGIDVHRDFLQISVMVRIEKNVKEYHFQCKTDHASLLHAKDFAIKIIEHFSEPHIDVDREKVRYACESTGNYHQPLLKAWGGVPIVVNPSIAKAGRRKSDRLDAKVLCQNALLGTWPESYIVSDVVHEIRTLNLQRDHCERNANRIGNNINSELLRYGVNVSSQGSVTLNHDVRNLVMDQLSEHPQMEPGCTVDLIPPDIKKVLKTCYEEWDKQKAASAKYSTMIVDKVCSVKWKCGDSTIDGRKMIDLLRTVPGIGETTAIVWLSTVICAHRFDNCLKCAAYCGFDPSNATSAGKVVSAKKRKGHMNIHAKLCQCAAVLINKASEPFGRWANQILQRTGSFSRARAALARKLCIALYYVQLKGVAFSYDSYRLEEPDVIDIRLEELVIIDHRFKRYVKKMLPLGISTTQEMVHWFQLCKFKKVKGLGKGFYSLVREFIDSQPNFEKLYVDTFGEEEYFEDEERTDYNE